ncbi:MAG: hypothetical protein DRI73_01185 [Bacteroidetes bacterium]|nr:MAG: hypothetical protein DRI73_01185 [Bacteroidota bacterium]
MKSQFRGFTVILFLILSLSLFNCKKKDTETQFVIKVDSIQLADTVEVGTALRIKFFGTIGPNGCYSFSHDETDFIQTTVSIKLWGKNSGAGNCPAVVVKLDGMYMDVNFNSSGTYTIQIVQPDNSKLTEMVVVEDS